MNREQFITRLEEVGFYREDDDLPDLYSHKKLIVPIALYWNKEIFCDDQDAYFFDELEQFLLDKGIVEPKFDAHSYLLSKGYSNDYFRYHHPSASYKICSVNNRTEVSRTDRDGNTWTFEGVTKESCDKAIGLINYLDSIDKKEDEFTPCECAACNTGDGHQCENL